MKKSTLLDPSLEAIVKKGGDSKPGQGGDSKPGLGMNECIEWGRILNGLLGVRKYHRYRATIFYKKSNLNKSKSLKSGSQKDEENPQEEEV